MILVFKKLFDKELLAWYFITLKLKETIEANLCKPQAKPIARPIPLGLYKSNPLLKPALTPQPLPPPPLDSPWIISILEKLEQGRQYEASSPWETQSIYRVPKSLRDVDQTAYTPKILSLGPYHLGRRRFRSMDRHKWRSLYHALDRTKHDIRHYLDAARFLEDRARSCYEAPISISSDAFVESLVLDSIFTLELFRCDTRKGFLDLRYSPKDPIFGDCNIILSLKSDMIMLENQLPLFVLDRFLALQLGDKYSGSALVVQLALRFFDDLGFNNEHLPSDPNYNAGSSEALHCLDVIHHSLVPRRKSDRKSASCPRRSSLYQLLARAVNFALTWPCSGDFGLPKPPVEKIGIRLIRCVAELREAGIKFRRNRKSDRFWDIKFKDGVLYIPRLIIDGGTKSRFLNLIAFEQCHLECGNQITSYFSFMDDLIDSEVDVGYLHDKGIIDHGLGSNGAVADMFNRLCREVVIDPNDCYLSELSEQVNRYYNKKWNTWRASLTHTYLSNPWAIISLIAAVVLLLLTAAQTFYAVYGYYKPN
ncbi:hypothetical protein M5K25_023198 [Dendrobium thyrsiflorum]|uniref:Uncharacterized protein n=1 Tax=Dendrobium thyrsiflorum TaxID=117978 RepID=A0ABD0U7L3_DENTH